MKNLRYGFIGMDLSGVSWGASSFDDALFEYLSY